jgi:hypothetical protein
MTMSAFGRLTFLSVVLPAAILLVGCKDMGTEPSPPPSGDSMQNVPLQTVSFQQKIRPIFADPRVGCLGCHGGSNGLSVGTPADLLRGGVHGPAVIPGNSANSLLVQKISANPPFGVRMPFEANPLPDSTIQLIRTWIDQGANDN